MSAKSISSKRLAKFQRKAKSLVRNARTIGLGYLLLEMPHGTKVVKAGEAFDIATGELMAAAR
jgi:hypothetical protein